MIIHIDRAKKKVSIKKEPQEKAAKSYIVIDYPQDGEAIGSEHYAVRIGAGGGQDVEVSIDGGGWQTARENCGYYWYDWQGMAPGEHTVSARMKLANGKFKKSAEVVCKVG